MMLKAVVFAVWLSSAISINVVEFDVDTSKLYTRTSEYLVSVTIDAQNIRKNWLGAQEFKAERMINMAKALSPAVLRLGGTAEDTITFNETATELGNFPNGSYAMNATQWDIINNFAMRINWNLTFGLNSLLRNPNGSWNSANALKLFKYTKSKGYQVSWELGNEPDIKQHQINFTVHPEQMAHDFQTLRSIIDNLSLNPTASIRLAGPDTTKVSKTGASDYYSRFLKTLGDGVVDAVTWHHYYGSNVHVTSDNFHDVQTLDSLIPALQFARSHAERFAPSAELWLGETNSFTGGGIENLTDAYASGFLWLDKLGLAAATNHSVVCRQQFYGNTNYVSLLDKYLNPNPDYFTTLLHKRLVGRGVLNVSGSTNVNRTVRVYAHCASSQKYEPGAVALLVVNIEKNSVQLKLGSLGGSQVDLYLLTPTSGSIDSREIDLNGETLRLINNSTLPDVSPKKLAPPTSITFPALTYGYVVLPNAKAEACIHD
ncbi:heparanase-like isoform X2 [Oscarella lobularis]|uniref:heparanase-like isoform X2 n=1 Tax=Oscarella lobularis TaxID=121494 RepID=UPI003313E63B